MISGMWKTVLSVSVAALALATAASAGGLPAGWTHAEINVYQNHTAHTLVYDRGHVTAVAPTALTLREADGSSVQVALAPTTPAGDRQRRAGDADGRPPRRVRPEGAGRRRPGAGGDRAPAGAARPAPAALSMVESGQKGL